jgi:hypothetical protein
MTKAYESIRQGLAEAIAYAQGKPNGARVHHVKARRSEIAESQSDGG